MPTKLIAESIYVDHGGADKSSLDLPEGGRVVSVVHIDTDVWLSSDRPATYEFVVFIEIEEDT